MDRILLGHGSGGELTHKLLKDVFFSRWRDLLPEDMDDATPISAPARIAVTTDTFTAKPLFFPGGDIGKLAITGTVNDLAVSTAKPLYITVGFVIEAGFPLVDLIRIVDSMGDTARRLGVKIVAGDTKVVESGKADGVYINTTGIGQMEGLGTLEREPIKSGDRVIVSGPIGDHAAAMLVARGELGLKADIVSDCAPVTNIVRAALQTGGVKWMRDPTRGGVATTLNELVMDRHDIGIRLIEKDIPIREEVKGIGNLLGIDPLYMACEGRVLMVVAEDRAEDVLRAIGNLPEGKAAAIIGEVTADHPGRVRLKTRWAERFVPMLPGEMLPRIC